MPKCFPMLPLWRIDLPFHGGHTQRHTHSIELSSLHLKWRDFHWGHVWSDETRPGPVCKACLGPMYIYTHTHTQTYILASIATTAGHGCLTCLVAVHRADWRGPRPPAQMRKSNITIQFMRPGILTGPPKRRMSLTQIKPMFHSNKNIVLEIFLHSYWDVGFANWCALKSVCFSVALRLLMSFSCPYKKTVRWGACPFFYWRMLTTFDWRKNLNHVSF